MERWKSEKIENRKKMEKWKNKKYFSFLHLYLVGGVEKWRDKKLFYLVERKLGDRKCSLYKKNYTFFLIFLLFIYIWLDTSFIKKKKKHKKFKNTKLFSVKQKKKKKTKEK